MKLELLLAFVDFSFSLVQLQLSRKCQDMFSVFEKDERKILLCYSKSKYINLTYEKFSFRCYFFYHLYFYTRAQYKRTALSWTKMKKTEKGSNRRNGASSMNRYRQGITIFGHCKVLAVLFADNFNCRGYLRRVYVLATDL